MARPDHSWNCCGGKDSAITTFGGGISLNARQRERFAEAIIAQTEVLTKPATGFPQLILIYRRNVTEILNHQLQFRDETARECAVLLD